MSKRNPWIYIPSLYFAEGLPSTIVMMMSAVYLKDIGADNILIGLSSWLQLPWTLKFIGAPLVDFFGKKRKWIVVAQMVLCILIAVLAFTTVSPDPVRFGIAAMAFIAIVSSIHDASIDGYYLDVLSKDQQALFVGVRNTAFRLSMIFGSGGMVWLAGYLSHQMPNQNAWLLAFGTLSVAMLMLFIWHSWYLPHPGLAVGAGLPLASAEAATESTAHATAHLQEAHLQEAHLQEAQLPADSGSADKGGASKENDSARPADSPPNRDYFKAILSYFDQPSILAVVCYLLLFRLGDALVTKMIPAFLLDPLVKNGMGLSKEQIGMVAGTVGVGCLLIGGIVGGYLVSKQGLRRWIWPATLLMDSTILLYWLLATYRPSSIFWVYIVNSLEQFGYGFGMAAYTVFMLTTVKKEYKAAHYAIATAFMSLGLMGPGAISGNIHVDLLGYSYSKFFLLSFFLTVPGMISILFLPIWRKDTSTTPAS